MELFLDLETLARPGAEALLPEPQAPANYKDEAKIAAYVEEADAELAGGERELLDIFWEEADYSLHERRRGYQIAVRAGPRVLLVRNSLHIRIKEQYDPSQSNR